MATTRPTHYGHRTMATTIAPEVLDVLKRSDIGAFFVKLPKGTLSRDIYVKTAKVCENFGGKWSRTAKAIVFDQGRNTADLVNAIVDGKYTSAKDEYSFFPTPSDLARRMCERAGEGVPNPRLILEPSAGKGAIVDEAFVYFPGDPWFNAIEINPEHCGHLRETRRQCRVPMTVTEADFLTLTPEPVYDVVLMNPPFSAPNKRDADAEHILHATLFLKPGGRLVAIAGAGLGFKTNGPALQCRHMVNAYGTIEELPEHSFKVSGTHVSTVLVTVDKPN